MQKLKRKCWWCNGRLMAVSHAVTKTGQWVHKVCLPDAEEDMRRLTAQPTSAAQMDAQLDDQLGGD